MRIGPNELSFNDVKNIKEINGQNSPMLKAKIYNALGRKSVFHMRDPEEHKERRKLLNHAFAPIPLNEANPIIMEHVKQFSEKLEHQDGQHVDILYVLR